MNGGIQGKNDIEEKHREYLCGGKKENDLECLVRAGERLVRYFALSITGGLSEDVLQAGREGLLKAAVRFDPGRGAAFSTYAGHYIMGEIRHYIRKEAAYYRSGRLSELRGKICDVRDDNLKKTGEAPPVGVVAGMLNVKEDNIVGAMRAGTVSLEEMGETRIGNLRYESFRLPVEDKLLVEQAVKKLNEVQRKVIYLLFYMDLTQTETARKLGINQRQVSRILHKSLQLLSKAISF